MASLVAASPRIDMWTIDVVNNGLLDRKCGKGLDDQIDISFLLISSGISFYFFTL